MPTHRPKARSTHSASTPPLLTNAEWARVIRSLQLSPQQARIVALILRGYKDKQIAKELSLNRYTIRTYLKRIFIRLGIDDRIMLVLHVFAVCLGRTKAMTMMCTSKE